MLESNDSESDNDLTFKSVLLQFGTIEPVFTALADSFRIWRKRRALLTALFSAVCFLVGLIMCTEVSIFLDAPTLFLFLSLSHDVTNKHIYTCTVFRFRFSTTYA